MFKVNNKNTRKTSSGAFNVNFEHISHLALVFLLLTLPAEFELAFNKTAIELLS